MALSYESTEGLLSGLEESLADEKRLTPACLEFVSKATGERLLLVGGMWDRMERAFTDHDVTPHRINVNENQVAIVRQFGEWLSARINGGPRKRLLLTGGNRRGGKSWIVTALASATAIAIPNAIIWLVSPALNKRDELEKYVKGHVPAEWRTYRARELRFVFLNGSTITNITGDDAEALKRGEADLIVYNEPQAMGEDVLTYGAPAIVDKGGLLLFAGNPARRRKGVWFTRIVKAIQGDKLPSGEFVRLSAEDNPDIDKAARSDIRDLIAIVNPEAERADMDGVFLEPGQFAYAEHFDEKRNTVATFPDIADNVTARVIKRKGGGVADTLVGMDFQGWPFNAGVEVTAVGDPLRPTWYVRRCITREGDEDLFLDDAFEAWEQPRTLFIGDASGTWQDAQHVKGRTSFDKFKARRWRIVPPRKKQTDRGEHPANPSREDRINLVNRLLDDARLIFCMDTAAEVAEDVQKCEVDSKGRPKGRHAHRTDALGYALWWGTDMPRPAARPLSRASAYSLPIQRSPNTIY